MDLIIKGFKELHEQKGYEWFDGNKEYNLNIFSLRSPSIEADTFDDYIFVICRDKNLNWIIKQYEVTTDPGTYHLKNPSNIKGTAILAPGQYKGVYKIDKHKGKYYALCQRNGTVKVYRDNNRDNILDHDTNMTDTGWFGINIHKAKFETTNVGPWSAGCTVFKNSSDFDEFMRLCMKASKIYGNKFTYTLFE